MCVWGGGSKAIVQDKESMGEDGDTGQLINVDAPKITNYRKDIGLSKI